MSVPYSYPAPQAYSNGHVPGMHPPGYTSMAPAQNGTGFAFRKRFERVDWRKIAAADVDHISRNMDFHTLQENIMNITFCNIESELDTRTVDPNFIKLFKLAQLTIEYLLHSQDYLAGVVSSLEEKLKKAVEEHEETKKALEQQKDELSEVKKESHKRKKMLAAQQQIMHAGANSYHKCAYCSKAFVNSTFLQSHLQRRHAEHMNSLSPLHQSAPPAGANQQLEKELTEIRDRLKMTESQLQDERSARNTQRQKEISDLQSKEENLQKDMESWKKEQVEAHTKEIDKMRDMFMKELREMTEKYTATQQALDNLQHKHNTRPSNLGTLKDDIDSEMLEKQKEELQQLVGDLKSQMEKSQAATDERMKHQENKWQNKLEQMNVQHQKELEQLNYLLEETSQELDNEKQHRGAVKDKYETQLQDLKQQKKDVQDKVKERDRQLKELASRPPQVAPREPIVQKAQAVSAARTPPARSQMQPEEDNEEDLEDEETEEEETSALGATGNLGNTLSETGGSTWLIDRQNIDPKVIKTTRDELSSILNEELSRMGVPQGSQGVKLEFAKKQLDILANKRQQTGKKYKNFFEIRRQHATEIEQQAMEKLQMQAKSPKPPGHGMARTPRGRSKEDISLGSTLMSTGQMSTAELVAAQAQSHLAASPQFQKQRPKSDHTSYQASRQHEEPPKPVPRAASPSKMMATASTMSSTGRSYTLNSTGSASQWESDTDDDDLDDVDGQYQRPKVNIVNKGNQSTPQRPVNNPQRLTSTPLRQEGVANKQHSAPYRQDLEEDSDWDSASELQEIGPKSVTNTESRLSQQQAQPRDVYQSPSVKMAAPRGEMVSSLTKSIEMQLQGRGNKKLAGAVDTMNAGQSEKKGTIVDDFDDDDDFSVSSLDDNLPPQQTPARRQPSRQSAGTDMSANMSSNTYGTSQWGSSSRERPVVSPRRHKTPVTDSSASDSFRDILGSSVAVQLSFSPDGLATSTAGNQGTRGSVGKSSLVSVTDFDDDDEYFDTDIKKKR